MQMDIRTENSSYVLTSIFILLFCLLPPQFCAEVSNITSSQPLTQGQTLVSAGQVFELGFFSPEGSANKYVGIWHMNMFPRKVVWVANREKPLAVADTLANLAVNINGGLELIDGKQNSVWSVNVPVSSNSSAAVLLDNGNFVVQDDKGDQLWKSSDYPTDTLLPNRLMGFNSTSGKGNFLTSWKSETDPSTGMFLVGLAPRVPTQVVVWTNESSPYWRSGPWDKSKFIGIPGMNDQYLSGFTVDDNVQQGKRYFSFSLSGNLFAYITISSNGTLEFMYSLHGKNWTLDWKSPNNPCDKYGACGPFGVCRATGSPICKCLKGFVYKSDEEWTKGNMTGGCVRQTKLFCDRNTMKLNSSSTGNDDGFWKVSSAKVPDFHEYVSSEGAENCRVDCLNNCSCLAYTYVTNIGCLVWSKDLIDIQEFSSGGVDLFIRLAGSEFGGGKRNKLIISITAICSICLLVAAVFGLHRLRANQRDSDNTKVSTKVCALTDTSETSRDTLQDYIRKHDPSELVIYNFETIVIATNNFSIANKLGEGGFGPVYKGKLEDGRDIAAKRLSSSSGQGIEEFKNEMLLICKLQHKNLVRLLGCSIKEDEKLLIYEFMSNKSLDTLLFDPTKRAVLDWPRRFNIIQGVARGLLYLHQDSCLKVIHRDLKVSNILLDENMNPKISDFGLARIVQGTQALENTEKVVGTLGYMSPEYAMRGIFSEKSDVYSFGVLLLEIVCGRKNTGFYYNEEQLGFLAYGWHLWNEGKGLYLVDEVLADSCSESEALRCVHIGLLCVQDKAADRPTMAEVVFMLSSETDLPQAKEPIFTFENSDISDPQPESDNIFPVDEDTITLIQGR